MPNEHDANGDAMRVKKRNTDKENVQHYPSMLVAVTGTIMRNEP
jgi:hypothetical protein